VDLYSARWLYRQKVWDTGTLAAGTHTVLIEWTGAKNRKATNAYLVVDAFDVLGALTTGDSSTQYLVTASTYDHCLSPSDHNGATGRRGGRPGSRPGRVVTWTKSDANGSFAAATSTTDDNGVATVVFTTHAW